MTHLVVKQVTTANETELDLERKITAGAGITLTDGGAGGDITIASTLDGSKLTELTAETSPALTDLLYLVIDPSTTPASRKMTLQTLKTALGVGDATGKYRQFLYTVISGNPTFLTDSDGYILTVALDVE